jgi:hypothetical protein
MILHTRANKIILLQKAKIKDSLKHKKLGGDMNIQKYCTSNHRPKKKKKMLKKQTGSR